MHHESVWLLQIYKMADAAAQKTLARMLAASGSVTVDTRTCDQGFFLFVDYPDESQADIVHELVTMADPLAELIHTTSGIGLHPDPDWWVRRREAAPPSS
jgi:hypothetical protein